VFPSFLYSLQTAVLWFHRFT